MDITSTVDFAALGITGQTILKAMTFGFGFVLSAFVLGWVAGIVIKMINKM